MSEYSVEEVRARFERWIKGTTLYRAHGESYFATGECAYAWRVWQAAYAERIEADKMAAPVGYATLGDQITYYVVDGWSQRVPPGTDLFTHPPAQAAQVVRPCREAAERSVADFLKEKLGSVPTFELTEDGENHWSFWVTEDGCSGDTTSYVHADLSIEWYGTAWEPTAEPVAQGEANKALAEIRAVPDGWVLVPCEPTEAMIDAANKEWFAGCANPTMHVWDAMLAAAPTPAKGA